MFSAGPIEWLKEEFEQRKKRNTNYSLRAFARDLDISHGNLSQYFSWKRKLTPDIGKRIAKNLALSQEDSRTLLMAIEQDHFQKDKRVFLVPPKAQGKFIGREKLVEKLKQMILAQKSVALLGLPGVGKSSLAVELGHEQEINYRFPDGILWVGLGLEPDLLAQLTLWSDVLEIPYATLSRQKSLAEKCSLIRSIIGMKKMLIVIDDGWDEASVNSFRLGGPNCVHILTSRLSNVATYFAGEDVVSVSELEKVDGVQLIYDLAPMTKEMPLADIENLVDSVGALPLGLKLMAFHLRTASRSQQKRRLQTAMDKLKSSQERLQLDGPKEYFTGRKIGEDTSTSLEVAIGFSDMELNEATRKFFYSLAVFPSKPIHFSEEAAVAIGLVNYDTLDELVDSGLLEVVSAGRYTIHQAISEYAFIKAQEVSDDFLSEAKLRMANFYIDNLEQFSESEMSVELSNLMHAVKWAIEVKQDSLIVNSAQKLADALRLKGLYSEAKDILLQARSSAERLKKLDAIIRISISLGATEEKQGNYKEAEEYYSFALESARKEENLLYQAQIHKNLGWVKHLQANFMEAEKIYLAGLKLAESAEATSLCGDIYNNLGVQAKSRGLYTQAENYYAESLKRAQQLDRKEALCVLYNNLAIVAEKSGELRKAKLQLELGLEISRKLDYPERIALIINNLGRIVYMLGQNGAARTCFEEGLRLARKISNKERTVDILYNMSLQAELSGEYEKSNNFVLEALEICEELGRRDRKSQLLTQKAYLMEIAGKEADALSLYEEAIDLAKQVKHDENQSTALLRKAKLLLQKEADSEVNKIIDEAIRICGENKIEILESQLYLLRSQLLFKNNQLQEAKSDLEQALSWAQEKEYLRIIVEAKLLQAELNMDLNILEDAYAQADFIPSPALKAEALYVKAKLLLKQKQKAKAKAACDASRDIFIAIHNSRQKLPMSLGKSL